MNNLYNVRIKTTFCIISIYLVQLVSSVFLENHNITLELMTPSKCPDGMQSNKDTLIYKSQAAFENKTFDQKLDIFFEIKDHSDNSLFRLCVFELPSCTTKLQTTYECNCTRVNQTLFSFDLNARADANYSNQTIKAYYNSTQDNQHLLASFNIPQIIDLAGLVPNVTINRDLYTNDSMVEIHRNIFSVSAWCSQLSSNPCELELSFREEKVQNSSYLYYKKQFNQSVSYNTTFAVRQVFCSDEKLTSILQYEIVFNYVAEDLDKNTNHTWLTPVFVSFSILGIAAVLAVFTLLKKCFAKNEGEVSLTVIYPNGAEKVQTLTLDNTSIAQVKKKLLTDVLDYSPEDYTIILQYSDHGGDDDDFGLSRTVETSDAESVRHYSKHLKIPGCTIILESHF